MTAGAPVNCLMASMTTLSSPAFRSVGTLATASRSKPPERSEKSIRNVLEPARTRVLAAAFPLPFSYNRGATKPYRRVESCGRVSSQVSADEQKPWMKRTGNPAAIAGDAHNSTQSATIAREERIIYEP